MPESARADIMAWREEALTGRKDLRPVAAEALHVTLVFLGYLPEKEIGTAAATAFAALSALEPPRLAIAEVRPVPTRDPRLFALDLSDEDGRATSVQSAASEALAAAKLYRPEKRPFWPHVTFARVKRGERRAPPVNGEGLPSAPFDASDVTLYRSHLSPRGARYEALERLRLGS